MWDIPRAASRSKASLCAAVRRHNQRLAMMQGLQL